MPTQPSARELFGAVADLSPAERRIYLERACPDNPALVAEVISLVEAAAGETGVGMESLIQREAEGVVRDSGSDKPEPSREATSEAAHGQPHIEFSPRGRPQLRAELKRVLRVRLGAIGLVLIGAIGFSIVRSLVLLEEAPAFHGFGVLAILVVGTILARHRNSMTLAQLRVVEYVMVFSVATLLILNQYAHLSQLATQFSGGLLDEQIGLRTAAPFTVLMFAYAMFVPNTWKTAAWVILPILAAPVVAVAVIIAQFPELQTLHLYQKFVEEVLFLGLSAIGALYGTHVINTLTTEAFEARRLGQYSLTERIGEGGMGEVWKARHRLLARPAAIKLIRPDRLGDQDRAVSLLKRFEREAQATATLTSVHTITLYDFGLTDDGVFYYVMELLDGIDLESLVLRFGPLPPARVAYLIEQACESLWEAHEQGLIHRDIKPANLFSCRLGGSVDFVKVLDFGLVKPITDAQATALTREGMVAGTPAFVAPEQALGRAVDARTDIYSLGASAYFLLTGHFVFEGSDLEILADHLKRDPVPPSVRIGMPLNDELEAIVLNCLAKDPQDRPGSADELQGRIGGCRFEPGWGSREARDWWASHMS